MMEHFCVTFGYPGGIGFWDIARKKTNRQTNQHINTAKNSTHVTIVGEDNDVAEVFFFISNDADLREHNKDN